MGNIKEQLHRLCLQQLDDKLHGLETATELARSAQQDYTKSSAGDKYETSREMMTQEIEKNTLLLSEVKQQKQTLLQISFSHKNSAVDRGSVVYTNLGNFYIGVSIGVVKYGNQSYQTVSPVSPIGKVLLGKKAGERFLFNAKDYAITEVL